MRRMKARSAWRSQATRSPATRPQRPPPARQARRRAQWPLWTGGGGMVFGSSRALFRASRPLRAAPGARAWPAHAPRWPTLTLAGDGRRGIRSTPKARVAKGTPARLSASRPSSKFCSCFAVPSRGPRAEAQLGQDIKILHTRKQHLQDKSQTPREYLVVVLDLPEHSVSGSEARKRQDMLLVAIAAVFSSTNSACKAMTFVGRWAQGTGPGRRNQTAGRQ